MPGLLQHRCLFCLSPRCTAGRIACSPRRARTSTQTRAEVQVHQRQVSPPSSRGRVALLGVPDRWRGGSCFSLAEVDPQVQGRRPGCLGGPWAWPGFLAIGKGPWSSAHPSSAQPSPEPQATRRGGSATDCHSSPARPALWPREGRCVSLSLGVHIHETGSGQQPLQDCPKEGRPHSGTWHHQ